MCSRRRRIREMDDILAQLEALRIYDRCFQPCAPPPCASPSDPTPSASPAAPEEGPRASRSNSSNEGVDPTGFHMIAPDPGRRARLEQQAQQSEANYEAHQAARRAAHYEVTPGGDTLGGGAHGLTETDIRRRRLAAVRPPRRAHSRSLSLPASATTTGSASREGPSTPRDPVVARLAVDFGENEARYALRLHGSEAEAREFLQGSLAAVRSNLNDERQALYQAFKFCLSMLWQANDALPRARRLLHTLLQAGRQARRDPAKCRIRAGNEALQAKVLWTPAGEELLRWLGFELSEREGVYILDEEERTSYIMGWRVQLLQGTLACLAESPVLVDAFLHDERDAQAQAQERAVASSSSSSSPSPRRERAQSAGGAIAAEEGEDGDEPPNEYMCPISADLMDDPVVVLETVQTYDRAHIERWFATGHLTDPLTGLNLSSTALAPNHELRRRIEAWKARHGWERA